MGDTSPPYDFTWAFVLREDPPGTTRLLVRERYGLYPAVGMAPRRAPEAVSFAMSQKMLRGIRDRAERLAAAATQEPNSEPI
jgi:hypothetical protein